MKKVLITGGAGFIGSNLAQELVRQHYDVIILDHLNSGKIENIKEFGDRVRLVNASITDYETINKYLSECNVVVHLAALVSVPKSFEEPSKTFEINTQASENIIHQCIDNRINFIFASSAAVYGDDKTEVKTEDIEPKPQSPYGISKLEVEKLCQNYHETKGLKFTSFRFFNVYGPRQSLPPECAPVIPSFISRALCNEDLIICGDGTQTRDFIYIEDVVDALIIAIENPLNDVFNLGCNDIKDIKFLAERIINLTGSKSKIIFERERDGDIKHSRASSEKLRKRTNWKAQINLEEGLKRTINYYKNV